MKIKTLLLLTLSAMLLSLITSCKKDPDSVTPAGTTPLTSTAKSCKLTSIKNNTGDSTIFSYDSLNRLSKIEKFDRTGKKIEYTSYTYIPGKILLTGRNESYYESTIILNADGTANRETRITNYGYGFGFDTTFYAYDTEGHNIRKLQATTSGRLYDTIVYTYTDGNLTKVTAPYYSNVLTYSSIKNVEPYTNNYLAGLYGKGSKNLPASSDEYFIMASNSYLYSYETNTEGYVTKQTSVFGNNTEIIYNNYICQ